MPRMKLSITSNHINDSIRSDANHCMIATAIKEKIPTARWVLVDLQSIRWTDRAEGVRYTYMTPKPAQKALLNFDKGLEVKPFHLTLPEPTARPIAKPARKRVAKKSKAKTKKVYKKDKIAPEQVAVRRHGLRVFE